MPVRASMRAGVRKRGVVPVLISDPLTGSGLLVGSSTPVGAKAWVAVFTSIAGTSTALTRAAGGSYVTTDGTNNAQQFASIDTGKSNLDVSVKIDTSGNAGAVGQLGLTFRGNTSANIWELLANTDGHYYLRKVVGGTATDFYSAGTVVSGDVLRATAVGSVITAYVNGVQVAQITDSFQSTDTHAGVLAYQPWTGGAGAKGGVSNFSVTAS